MTTRKLVNRTEETATHTLGHILGSSEVSRQALRNFLLTHGVDIGEVREVKTAELFRPGKGTPDLATLDEHRQERLLLEAKFGAGLTRHQPVTYLRRLPKDTPSALLFVVPAYRLEEVWQELIVRVSEDERLERGDVHKEPELRWCDIDGYHKLLLSSWRFLLDSIAAQAGSAVAQTVNDMHQLQGIAELRLSDPRRPGPLPPEFPRSLPLLYALVDDAAEELEKRSLAEISDPGYRPSVHRQYSVRYMTFCGVVNVSFGVYVEPWTTYHHNPLWFAFPQNRLQGHAINRLAVELMAEAKDGQVYVPIHLHGSQYEAVLRSIVGQIERIATIIEPDLTTVHSCLSMGASDAFPTGQTPPPARGTGRRI